ncbi:MAG: TRAP transporter small permease [Rhodobacter sp.]|nr:TRAP transporter small permease [Rhodobacter sp.]MCY4169745.1 TRAP transporter small permease [Rhodobacter sp.]MCY4241030.1 TRAP transporter small permease [Rhodobacter sp.]
MTPFQLRLLAVSRTLVRIAVWASGLMMFAVAMLIGAEVLLRKFAGISTGGADELSGYALAISSSWAFGFALLQRAHVRVEAFHTWLGTRTRAYLNCLSVLCLATYGTALAYFCANVLIDTIELRATSNTTLGVPLWIPQTLWLAGLVLFAAVGTLLFVLSLAMLVRREFETVQILVGSRTVSDEIKLSATPPVEAR